MNRQSQRSTPSRIGTPRDVYGACRFWVEIDQIVAAAFSECSGLQVETDVFEWEEGGINEYRHRLPGRLKYSNIVLKRGIADQELWNWYAQQTQGIIRRRNMSIFLRGYDDRPDAIWNIVYALPIKWIGPNLKSGAAEVAVETIELIHCGFQRTK
ncbi:MAG TPA: phage tail protein [Roseiflexaceae bacterium]|nr:phage tail protein [Roseiflexaceae bacterium]